MVMRQGAAHGNGQTEPRGFIFDGQAPEGFSVAIGIVDEIPTPAIVLGLGPGLDSASGAELSATFSAREPEPLLLPHTMNPLEIHLPAAALEKTPRQPVPPVGIAPAHAA